MTSTESLSDEMKCGFELQIMHQAYLACVEVTSGRKENLRHWVFKLRDPLMIRLPKKLLECRKTSSSLTPSISCQSRSSDRVSAQTPAVAGQSWHTCQVCILQVSHDCLLSSRRHLMDFCTQTPSIVGLAPCTIQLPPNYLLFRIAPTFPEDRYIAQQFVMPRWIQSKIAILNQLKCWLRRDVHLTVIWTVG